MPCYVLTLPALHCLQVSSVRRIFVSPHDPACLPPETLTRFFSSVDTVFQARLAMVANGLGSRMPPELALTPYHVGRICAALGHLAGLPGATLT